MTVFEVLLARASYEGLRFPVEASSLDGGHDSVKHKSRRKRGADVEWTGQREYAGTLRIPLYHDLTDFPRAYPDLYRELVGLFERRPQGTLVHPTRGEIRVQIDSWKESLDSKTTNGFVMELAFTEVDASAQFGPPDGGLVQVDPGQRALDLATKVDEYVVQSVPVATDRPALVAPVIADQITFLEEESRGYSDLTAAIDTMVSAVTNTREATSLQGLVGHDARAACAELLAAVFEYRAEYLGGAEPREIVVSDTMSLAQIAALPYVYGDAGRAADLLAANTIVNALRVPAGTRLRVVD